MKSQGRSCEGKERLTREQARAVLREMHARNARRGGDKHHVNAYRCDFCGTHHVGHTSAPKQPQYKRKRWFRAKPPFGEWVGVYWDKVGYVTRVYVCLVPCLPILFKWRKADE